MLLVGVNYFYRDAKMVYGCSSSTSNKGKHQLSFVSKHKMSGSEFALTTTPTISLVNNEGWISQGAGCPCLKGARRREMNSV